MSGVVDGQGVTAAVSNAAWLAKNGDDTGTGRVTLAEIASGVSGAQVDNIQREHNAIASFVGMALNSVYNILPTWASSFVGVSTDTVKARLEAVILKFKGTTGTGGHAHAGTDGDGAKISGSSIASGAATIGQVLTADGSGGSSYLDAAGGGGGGSLEWVESTNAPTPSIDNNNQVYAFQSGLGQVLYALIKVPSSYAVGKPIKLKLDFYSPDSSGTALIQSVATLIRQGTDTMSSTANQRTSTNAAVTLGAGTVNIPQGLALDLSDTTGHINAVAVSPGDFIQVQLTRSTDTGASDLKVPVYGAEMTTT